MRTKYYYIFIIIFKDVAHGGEIIPLTIRMCTGKSWRLSSLGLTYIKEVRNKGKQLHFSVKGLRA